MMQEIQFILRVVAEADAEKRESEIAASVAEATRAHAAVQSVSVAALRAEAEIYGNDETRLDGPDALLRKALSAINQAKGFGFNFGGERCRSYDLAAEIETALRAEPGPDIFDAYEVRPAIEWASGSTESYVDADDADRAAADEPSDVKERFASLFGRREGLWEIIGDFKSATAAESVARAIIGGRAIALENRC